MNMTLDRDTIINLAIIAIVVGPALLLCLVAYLDRRYQIGLKLSSFSQGTTRENVSLGINASSTAYLTGIDPSDIRLPNTYMPVTFDNHYLESDITDMSLSSSNLNDF